MATVWAEMEDLLFTSINGLDSADSVAVEAPAIPSTSCTALAAAPAISVVIRTLGSNNHLADALASLDRQEWRDFEVVVVDMSEGKMTATLDRFERQLPALRRVLLSPSPRAVALNEGISVGNAPLIAILDDDNIYDPAHLSILAGALEDPVADYVYTGVRHATYTRQGEYMTSRDVSIPFDYDRLLLGNYIYATGSAYRKAAWERVGGYDRRFTVFEDWDFLIRVATTGKLRHIPVVSSESRKFTGIPGVTNFDLEIESVRRCHAGIHWKHRHLLDASARQRLKREYTRHCLGRQPARKGLLSRTLGGWRLELGWDLLSWWWSQCPLARKGAV